MDYDDFISELDQAGISGREFCRLLKLNPNSISNYKKLGVVPSHLAVIAALIHTMKDAGIDHVATIARVPIKPKAGRGTSLNGARRAPVDTQQGGAMNPFERAPGQPEPAKIVTCPYCGGQGKVESNGTTVPCKPCNGTGGVRDR